MQGHLRQRGKAGPYYAVFGDGRDENGKRRQRWVNLQTTSKRAAERELAKILAKQAEGMLPPPNRQTLAKYLRVWLDTRRLGHKDPATTSRLYGHALPGDQREAAGKVADVLRRASAARKAKEFDGQTLARCLPERQNGPRVCKGRSSNPCSTVSVSVGGPAGSRTQIVGL